MMVKFVTDLGDAAFLLPASLIVACHLLVVRSRAAALTWSSTVALCAALTLLAKIASLACGHQFPSLAIHSPSGHASLSTTFCLCGALMLSAQRPPPAQIALASAGICIVVAIAASRALAVAMHGRHFGVETRLAQLVARIQRADLGYAKICLPDKQWTAAAARPVSLAPGEPDSGRAPRATAR